MSDDVDALGVGEHVRAPLRVIHQSFDAADQRGVDLRLRGLEVHRFQEVQDARQPIEIYEACHEAEEHSTSQSKEMNSRTIDVEICTF